jgi:glycosyltransferase involved in cell wall biosynthesis
MQHPGNRASVWSPFFVEEIEFGQHYSLLEKLQRIPKVIYSFEARKKLSALLDKVSPDICHCHSIYHHISPSILSLLRKRNIPTVMTIHDLKLACPAYHMYNSNGLCEACKEGGIHSVVKNRCIKESLVLSTIVMAEAFVHNFLGSYKYNIDKFISPCRFYIDKLVEFGWDRNQFVHIPNPVDVNRYRPAYDPGKAYILYFGRLSPEKGLITLLQAANQERINLVLAGDGPQRRQLEALAKSLKIEVVFTGHLKEKELGSTIEQAKVTVLPAEWYENAPISILESYAMGKPVIAADIGGIPELVKDGLTGKLFPSGSVSELARLLRYFQDMSDEEVIRYGRNARRHVENHYSSQIYLERMQKLYADICADQVAAPTLP